MRIRWLDPLALDARDVDGAVAVKTAVQRLDAPYDEVPPLSSRWASSLIHGWDGEPPRAAVAVDAHGRVVGVLELSLPMRDNQHLGWVQLGVDPAVRRSGVGSLLLNAAMDEIRAAGRRVLVGDFHQSPPAEGFAAAHGLVEASRELARRQDLWRLDPGLVTSVAEEARAHASAYELVRIPAPAPTGLVDQVVAVLGAINDAPTDDLQLEDEQFSAARLSAFYAAQAAYGRRLYHLAARRHGDTALAGHTMVAVDADHPFQAYQFDTSVRREHRGHRLGLLLKSCMVQWLAEAEPQLRNLDTWNAASNEHMVAVNERLGYRVVGASVSYQKEL